MTMVGITDVSTCRAVAVWSARLESGSREYDHQCGLYHYGDQSVVRPCCVENCRKWAQTALQVAFTDQHPAYRTYVEAWNSLSDAEMALVPSLYYSGIEGGIVEASPELRAVL